MIKVYLSNDGSAWIDTYPNTSPHSGQQLSTCVENTGLKVYSQITFADASSNKLTISVSGYSSQLEPFRSYKWIKIVETEPTQHTEFIGCIAMQNEKVINTSQRELQIIYDDLTTKWREIYFKDVQSLAYQDNFAMVQYAIKTGTSQAQVVTFDKAQALVVINRYISELQTHYNACTDINLQNTIAKELDYWNTIKTSYQSSFGFYKHELRVATADGYVVCNNNDKQHSMVHKLFSFLTDINVETTYEDETPVRFMHTTDDDNVLDILNQFLTQNGLGWYLSYPDNTVYVVAFDNSDTATSVQNVYQKAQIKVDNSKLEDYNVQDDIRYITKTNQKTGILYKITVEKDRNGLVDFYTPWYYGNRDHSGDARVTSLPSYQDRPYLDSSSNERNAITPFVKEVQIETAYSEKRKKWYSFFTWNKDRKLWNVDWDGLFGGRSGYSRQYPTAYGIEGDEFYIDIPSVVYPYYSTTYTAVPNIVPQMIVCYFDAKCNLTYHFVGNKTGANIGVGGLATSRWGTVNGDYAYVQGRVTIARWSNPDRTSDYPLLKSTTGDPTRMNYLFSRASVRRFRRARLWYNMSSAKTWTFESPDKYSLMQYLRIANVDDVNNVVVTKIEKDLGKPYEGYKYTCVATPLANLNGGSGDVVTDVEVTYLDTDFTYELQPFNVQYDCNGVAKTNVPVKIYVQRKYQTSTISATYNGTALTLTDDGDHQYFEIPINLIAGDRTGTIVCTSDNYSTSKSFAIQTTKDPDTYAIQVVPSKTSSYETVLAYAYKNGTQISTGTIGASYKMNNGTETVLTPQTLTAQNPYATFQVSATLQDSLSWTFYYSAE